GVELAEAGAGAMAQRQAGSHHVAIRRLDLDDLGTEIGEHARAMRSGDRGGEIKNPQVRQRSRGDAGHVRTAARLALASSMAPCPIALSGTMSPARREMSANRARICSGASAACGEMCSP